MRWHGDVWRCIKITKMIINKYLHFLLHTGLWVFFSLRRSLHLFIQEAHVPASIKQVARSITFQAHVFFLKVPGKNTAEKPNKIPREVRHKMFERKPEVFCFIGNWLYLLNETKLFSHETQNEHSWIIKSSKLSQANSRIWSTFRCQFKPINIGLNGCMLYDEWWWWMSDERSFWPPMARSQMAPCMWSWRWGGSEGVRQMGCGKKKGVRQRDKKAER